MYQELSLPFLTIITNTFMQKIELSLFRKQILILLVYRLNLQVDHFEDTNSDNVKAGY